jgi:hypothetical protein
VTTVVVEKRRKLGVVRDPDTFYFVNSSGLWGVRERSTRCSNQTPFEVAGNKWRLNDNFVYFFDRENDISRALKVCPGTVEARIVNPRCHPNRMRITDTCGVHDLSFIEPEPLTGSTSYIYGLSAGPGGRVRYVGRTNDITRRFGEHQRGNQWATGRWVKELKAANRILEIRLLQEVAYGEDVHLAEANWVKKFRGNNLVNRKPVRPRHTIGELLRERKNGETRLQSRIHKRTGLMGEDLISAFTGFVDAYGL